MNGTALSPMNDLRFAFRQLLKNPGFAAVAVLTLAVGIGANTVVFSVARTVLLRPLGFENEDRLMWIQRVNTRTGATENQVSWRDMEDIRTLTQSFEAVATDASHDMDWNDRDQTRRVPVVYATPHSIPALNSRPSLGRLFVPSDSSLRSRWSSSVMIYGRPAYEGSPDVLGQTVRLGRQTPADRRRASAWTPVSGGAGSLVRQWQCREGGGKADLGFRWALLVATMEPRGEPNVPRHRPLEARHLRKSGTCGTRRSVCTVGGKSFPENEPRVGFCAPRVSVNRCLAARCGVFRCWLQPWWRCC